MQPPPAITPGTHASGSLQFNIIRRFTWNFATILRAGPPGKAKITNPAAAHAPRTCA
ncbi:MAG: hypothetical protein LBC18_07535 [Opitutaceae bacterium]|nr:hypothetical protein [Opitutaceae bacterium]